MSNGLEFAPVSEHVQEMLGSNIWQARHGAFEYTIVCHHSMQGFDISIACIAPYLPRGPFQTYEDAVSACNAAVRTLEG